MLVNWLQQATTVSKQIKGTPVSNISMHKTCTGNIRTLLQAIVVLRTHISTAALRQTRSVRRCLRRHDLLYLHSRPIHALVINKVDSVLASVSVCSLLDRLHRCSHDQSSTLSTRPAFSERRSVHITASSRSLLIEGREADQVPSVCLEVPLSQLHGIVVLVSR